MSTRRPWLTGSLQVILSLTTVAAYSPMLKNGFVFDDLEYIVTNTHLRQGFLEACAWAFTAFYSANWHPLTWLSHFVDVRMFGLEAKGHHLVNLLFHVANTLLLLTFLRLATGRFWRSIFVAALFALHPLHVESVAWVAERKDLLSTFFLLLALIAYSDYAAKPSVGRYASTLLLFALGLLSKPMLVTFPFVLLLLDWWPLARSAWGVATVGRSSSGWSCLIVEKIPFLLLSVLSATVTVLAQSASGAIKTVPAAVRLANVPVAYAGYLRKLVWPQGLAHFYPLPLSGIPPWRTAGALLLLLCLSALVVYLYRRRPWLAVGWCWYLGTLVPVVGFVQAGLQSMADRYTYVPFIGLFVILAWSGAELCGWRRGIRLIAWAAGAATVVLGILTYFQCGVWRDDATLSRNALAVTSNNWLAHNYLAVELMKQGSHEEAIWHLRRALSINPLLPEAYYSLGVALTARGRLVEALSNYLEALRLKPAFHEAHVGAALTLVSLGKPEAAAARYRQALRFRPDDEVAHINLANILDDLGRSDGAIAEYREALRVNPANALAHYNVGIVLQKKGLWSEARGAFLEALRIRPNFPEARHNLEQVSSRIRN